jgi:hypothetical protein
MFGLLRLFFWAGCSVWLAFYLARGDVMGRPPIDYLEAFWESTSKKPEVKELKREVEGAVADAKLVLDRRSKHPREVHTSSEREALHRLVTAPASDAKKPTR